ncbi:hydrolase [Kosakonia sp. HypNH10]|uniref:hydrolase n=1 Tax=Kosakonia sp. HypNH10 TaxID=2980101 RepID=UPI002448CB38|nr:hydrolase [Kosakonia sp. HypNH10]MDH2913856.1 hydrolase [Kosakonia sp. HypNH10]
MASGIKKFWQQSFYLQSDSSSKNNLCKIQKSGLSSKISSAWINHSQNLQIINLISHHHVYFCPYAIPVLGKTHVGCSSV